MREKIGIQFTTKYNNGGWWCQILIAKKDWTGFLSDFSELLTGLDLSRNELDSLPPGIGKLTNLNQLWIGYNQLATIPAEIFRLEGLTKLSMPRNNLTSLPPEISQLENLEVLDLWHNQITGLPPGLSDLSHLNLLYIDDNRLDDNSMDLIKKLEQNGVEVKCSTY